MYRFFLESVYYRPVCQSSGIVTTGPGSVTVLGLIYTGDAPVVSSELVKKTRNPLMNLRHGSPVKINNSMQYFSLPLGG